MEAQNEKRIFWTEAATGGLVLGLVFVAVMIINYIFRLDFSGGWITSVFSFLAIIAIGYMWGKRMAAIRGEAGFTFGNAFLFLLVIMILSGFISGIGSYLMQNIVDPQYYTDAITAKMAQTGRLSEEMIDRAVDRAVVYMRNPLVLILGSVFSMALQGGIVSLAIAAFVKRPPVQQF